MRTDVKVGLICVFALVLAVVAYFAFQSNPDKQKAVDTSTVATGSTPAENGGGGMIAATPAEAATTSAPSMTAPETPIAGGGSLLGSRTALAQVQPDNSFTVPVISPPGTPASAPAPYPSPTLVTTPTVPATGPALSGAPSLLPPVSPTPSMPAPTITPTPTVPRSTIDLSPPSHRTPSFETPSFPSPGETLSPAPSGNGSTYVIQKGDMLGAIAKKNGVTLKALEAANPGVNPNKLKVGAKINIPAAGATAETPTTPTTPGKAGKSATTKPSKHATTRPATTRPAHTTITPGSDYTIKKGDTLRKIAKAAYGDENAWRRIFRANRGDMADANDITVGEVIRIPK